MLFADDNERRNFENYLKELQLQEIHLPIVQFYNSKGEVIETMENLSCLQQPKIPNDATEVEGIFEISAYIKIEEKLFAIKGIEYKHVPIKQITEVFTIESNGNATMLIKSDKLGINKLVTDTDMVNAMLNILEKSK